MDISFMRYNMERSGNIKRIYFAIKSSEESKSDNKDDIMEYFIKKYSDMTKDINGKGGLTKPRSVEPFLSMARELGFLRQRYQTRTWLITEGAGKAFLDLYDIYKIKLNLLILTQLLKNDRTFLIPYLKEIINHNYYNKINNRDMQINVVENVWNYMWNKYSRKLSLIEPLVKVKLSDRTKLMYADARKSLLFEKKGLNLNKDQIKRFVDTFDKCEYTKVKGDLYLKMSYVYYNNIPFIINKEELNTEINKVISFINIKKYVSAYRIFSIINEINLPDRGITWPTFLNMIRNERNIQINSSFTKGDYLLNFK